MRMGADGVDLPLQGLQVFKGIRPFVRVPQQGGGVINSHHLHAALFRPLAVLPGNFEIGADQPHGGDTAQAYDDFRLDQGDLGAQISNTGVLLGVQRITVVGRAAFDNIGNVHLGCGAAR